MRFPFRLHRNRHGVYGFRLLIPTGLQSRVGRTELRFTLKTSDLTIAKQLSMHLNARILTLYARLSRMSDHDPTELSRLLLGDLTTERDRVTAEILRIAADLGVE